MASASIQILVFGILRERLGGQSSIAVALEAGASVIALKQALRAQYPALAVDLDFCRIAVGGDYAHGDQVIKAGEEVAIIPPVSGGHF